MSSLAKYIKLLMVYLLLLFSLFFIANWEGFPYTLSTNSNHIITTTNNNKSLKDIVIPESKNSTLDKISKAFLWTDFYDKSNPAAFYISKFVNYFLGILAFISFITLVYWFSLVFTWKTDEWIKKWGKFLKMSIISIIVIWVSWLISMWIFWIYSTTVVN